MICRLLLIYYTFMKTFAICFVKGVMFELVLVLQINLFK